MNETEIKALVSLLDDDDSEVATLIEQEIKQRGDKIIPFLETEWEQSGLAPTVQKKIEDIIRSIQFERLSDRLLNWYHGGALDFLEGLWILNTFLYPDLEYAKLKEEIEQLYYEAWLEFRPDMHPVDQIKMLNHVFFNKLQFAPNTKSFHSANNSMLSVVLDGRKGNPISLCCIYMLIAQRLGMPLYGVNLPNLFVLTYKKDNVQFYINVFNKGLVFMKADIDHYIAQLKLKPVDTFFEPCTNLDIIKRVLRNLGVAFQKVGELEKLNEIEKLAKLLEESTPEEGFF